LQTDVAEERLRLAHDHLSSPRSLDRAPSMDRFEEHKT
jgi:hypothetical protein